ncbi:MAG: EpsG family protein [Oscillospiraceae bacterium]|nr:EpsG family protein [Oscillospiraceae bacterium]
MITLPLVPCLLYRFVRFKGANDDTHKKAAMFLFFSVLLVLVALRAHSVGRDTSNYAVAFKRFSHWSFQRVLTYKEPAFSLLCKGLSYLTDDFQWLVAISAFISIYPIFVLYKNEVEFPMTTVVLFLMLSNFYLLFSGMRQAIAVSLGVIAYVMTKRKKLIPFILIVVLAFLFHRSAMILGLMYPLYNMRIRKRSLFIVVIVMILIYVFNRQIFHFFQGIIQDYEDIGNKETGAFAMLFLMIIFSIFAFVVPDESRMDSDTIGLRNFLLMATAVQMFAPLNYLVMRMGYYYLIFLPITLPKIMKESSDRWRQVAAAAHYVILVFFALRFLLTAASSNTLDIFPYRFFWEMV